MRKGYGPHPGAPPVNGNHGAGGQAICDAQPAGLAGRADAAERQARGVGVHPAAGHKISQATPPRPPDAPWPPRTYQEYCRFQQHALACVLSEDWLYDRMQLLVEEAMGRRFMPVFNPPYQVFPFRGTHFGGDREYTTAQNGGSTWETVLDVTMPAGARGVIRGVANAVVEPEAWQNITWRIQVNGGTVAGFGIDPLDSNVRWATQWGQLDRMMETNIIIGERQQATFQVLNEHATDAFNVIARWHGWHWPQLVGRQDGAHGNREP